MSLQSIIDTAQTIEIVRNEVVAQTVSRSGKIYAGRRVTVKPWSFRITPAPLYRWADYRSVIENILIKDKYLEHTVKLGNKEPLGGYQGNTWLTAYQGDLTLSSTGQVPNITITNAGSNSFTIATSSVPNNTVIFRTGDIIQPVSHRYPYVVTADVTKNANQTALSVPLHRLVIGTISGNPGVIAGPQCQFNVVVSDLPAYRMTSGRMIEFTGDFSVVENVI